jgi:hypothetical protein
LFLPDASSPRIAWGGGGGVTTEPLTGEQLVTIRIPAIANAARALTVEQARAAIDFYEVVFKHTVDGRLFTASATKDKVLSLQLPVGRYETVLLAGTKNSGTLLAAAYNADENIAPDTNAVYFSLKALEVAVNGEEEYKIEFDNPPLTSPSGTTSEGFPYFLLPTETENITGKITIGNFPPGAIFDPELFSNGRQPGVQEIVNALKNLNALDLSFTAYEKFFTEAKEASDKAETLVTQNRFSLYSEAALQASTAYSNLKTIFLGDDPEVVGGIAGIIDDMKIAIGSLITAITNFADADSAWTGVCQAFEDINYPTQGELTDAKDKAQTASEAYNEAGTVVGRLGNGEGSNLNTISEVGAATTASNNVEWIELPSTKELQDAIALVNAAIPPVTSNVSMGYMGWGSVVDGAEPVTLAVTGYVDIDNGVLEFTLTTGEKAGFTKLYFDFAFKAFGSSAVNTWHIKEGLENYFIDNGTNWGGSILLAIGRLPDSGSGGTDDPSDEGGGSGEE